MRDAHNNRGRVDHLKHLLLAREKRLRLHVGGYMLPSLHQSGTT